MDPTTAGFLVAAGFTGGFIDSVVGGGGVITLPALLVVGLPPQMALGSNKLAGTAASATATTIFGRARTLDRGLLLVAMPLCALGGVVGALIASHLDPGVLRVMVAVAVALTAAYVLLRRRAPGVVADAAPAGARRAGIGALAAIGFYDGILGPGTGLFMFAVLSGPMRYAFVTAAGNGRALNLASNVGALVTFALLGRVDVLFGVVMAAGVIVGARLGSGMAVKRGDGFVRLMLGVAAVLLLARLLLQITGH